MNSSVRNFGLSSISKPSLTNRRVNAAGAFALPVSAAGAFSLPTARMVYTADEAKGTNEFLNTCLEPFGKRGVCIPDVNLNPRVPKAINYNLNLSGSTSYLLWFTPQSRIVQLQIYSNHGTDQHPIWAWLMDVAPDQVLGENFSVSRYVSSGIQVLSNTIASGAFAVQGSIYAVNYQDPTDFQTLTAQAILASRVDETSYVENELVANGVVCISQPAVDLEFRLMDNNASENSGPYFEAVFEAGYWITNTANYPLTTQTGYTPPFYDGSLMNILTVTTPLLPFLMKGRTKFAVDIEFLTHVTPLYTLAGPGTFVIRGLDILGNITCSSNFGKTGATVGGSSGGHPVLDGSAFHIEGYFYSTTPIATIQVSYTPSTLAVPVASDYGVRIKLHNEVVVRPGEISNGSIIVVNNVSASQSITVNSIINYEAVPNAQLAQNVQTGGFLLDNVSDLEAVKLVMGNKSHFGIRGVYTNSQYQDYLSGEYFIQKSQRDAIRVGAFGLSDLLSFVKPVANMAAPILDSIFPGSGGVVSSLSNVLSADAHQEHMGGFRRVKAADAAADLPTRLRIALREEGLDASDKVLDRFNTFNSISVHWRDIEIPPGYLLKAPHPKIKSLLINEAKTEDKRKQLLWLVSSHDNVQKIMDGLQHLDRLDGEITAFLFLLNKYLLRVLSCKRADVVIETGSPESDYTDLGSDFKRVFAMDLDPFDVQSDPSLESLSITTPESILNLEEDSNSESVIRFEELEKLTTLSALNTNQRALMNAMRTNSADWKRTLYSIKDPVVIESSEDGAFMYMCMTFKRPVHCAMKKSTSTNQPGELVPFEFKTVTEESVINGKPNTIHYSLNHFGESNNTEQAFRAIAQMSYVGSCYIFPRENVIVDGTSFSASVWCLVNFLFTDALVTGSRLVVNKFSPVGFVEAKLAAARSAGLPLIYAAELESLSNEALRTMLISSSNSLSQLYAKTKKHTFPFRTFQDIQGLQACILAHAIQASQSKQIMEVSQHEVTRRAPIGGKDLEKAQPSREALYQKALDFEQKTTNTQFKNWINSKIKAAYAESRPFPSAWAETLENMIVNYQPKATKTLFVLSIDELKGLGRDAFNKLDLNSNEKAVLDKVYSGQPITVGQAEGVKNQVKRLTHDTSTKKKKKEKAPPVMVKNRGSAAAKTSVIDFEDFEY